MSARDRYKDVGNVVDKFRGVKYKDAIEQGLDNLFRVARGERLFRPDFGSDIDDVVFDPINETTEFWLRSKVYEALMQEERIRVLRVDVSRDVDRHVLNVEVEYVILLTGEAFIYKRELAL